MRLPTYAEACVGVLVQSTIEAAHAGGHYRRLVYRLRNTATAVEALFWFEGHRPPPPETQALEVFSVQARTITTTVWQRTA